MNLWGLGEKLCSALIFFEESRFGFGCWLCWLCWLVLFDQFRLFLNSPVTFCERLFVLVSVWVILGAGEDHAPYNKACSNPFTSAHVVDNPTVTVPRRFLINASMTQTTRQSKCVKVKSRKASASPSERRKEGPFQCRTETEGLVSPNSETCPLLQLSLFASVGPAAESRPMWVSDSWVHI